MGYSAGVPCNETRAHETSAQYAHLSNDRGKLTRGTIASSVVSHGHSGFIKLCLPCSDGRPARCGIRNQAGDGARWQRGPFPGLSSVEGLSVFAKSLLRPRKGTSAGLGRSAAVMLITQADPGWDPSDGTRAPLRNARTLAETDGQPDGYQQFLIALRDEVVAFRKPVAYIHGDSHYFRIDRPFQDAQGRRLENFTRVETFGDNQGNGNNDVQWLKVLVDARTREVFSYQTQIVPANRVAVPAL